MIQGIELHDSLTYEGIHEGIASSEKIDRWLIKVSQGIVLRECTLFKC
jgi:hypothetical protein